MADLILTTFDWVPETAAGLCARPACALGTGRGRLALSRRERAVWRSEAEHFAHQPFGQVPWLTDGDISIFESGAILLHLGELQ